MDQSIENGSVLKLDHLVFDRITFRREDFPNTEKVKYRFGFAYKEQEENCFVVHLNIKAKKKGEYKAQVSASGYFTSELEMPVDLSILQSAAAIVLPYIRSQLSLLTAQPEMEPLVLPPLNVMHLVEEALKAEPREEPQDDDD